MTKKNTKSDRMPLAIYLVMAWIFFVLIVFISKRSYLGDYYNYEKYLGSSLAIIFLSLSFLIALGLLIFFIMFSIRAKNSTKYFIYFMFFILFKELIEYLVLIFNSARISLIVPILKIVFYSVIIYNVNKNERYFK